MSNYWQNQERMTVAAAASSTFSVSYPWGASRLTIWAVAPANVTMTLQPQINGINFGPATTVAAAPLADLVFSSGGSATEDVMLPVALVSTKMAAPTASYANPHPFNFTVLVSNTGAAEADLTLYACARLHTNN